MTDDLQLFQIVARVVVALAVMAFAIVALVRVIQYVSQSLAPRPRVIVKRNRRPPLR